MCMGMLFHAMNPVTLYQLYLNINKKLTHIRLFDLYSSCTYCDCMYVCHPDRLAYIHSHIFTINRQQVQNFCYTSCYTLCLAQWYAHCLRMLTKRSKQKKLFAVCVEGIVCLTNMIAEVDTDAYYIYFVRRVLSYVFGGGIFNEFVFNIYA